MRQSSVEQHKLVAEKNALIETVKRLNRELAKLEHFKKSLLQQLQDDEQVSPNTSCLGLQSQLPRFCMCDTPNFQEHTAVAAYISYL